MTGYFTQLEQELVSAAARHDAARTPGAPERSATRRRIVSRRMALIAAGLLVVAGVPAAAVTGVFRPHREVDGLVRLSEPRVILEGATPDRGHWQLLASRSDRGFCFGIRLPADLPGATRGVFSEACGGAEPGSLSVATSSGGSVPRNGLAFGMTPDGAERVRIEARRISVTVKTLDDHAGLEGRFYVAELPIRTSLGRTTVRALDQDGNVIGTTAIGAAH